MTASKKRQPASETPANILWENVKQIGLAVILALFIKTSVVEAYKIPSGSMEDTLLIGDFLLANKFTYGARLPLVDYRLPAFNEPERGDIVIFIYPVDRVTKYIKRCIGLPGDIIQVRNKKLFVNGARYDDPEFSKTIDRRILPRGRGGRDSRDNFGPFTVPPDSYFMMGDNRDNSQDSRVWGPVHRDLILGEAMMVHWSWDESIHHSPMVSVSDPLSVPRLFAYNIVHFFQKVRWDRLFGPIS